MPPVGSAAVVIALIVLLWCAVALVFGLVLARVLGGISHGAPPEHAREPEESDRLARSA